MRKLIILIVIICCLYANAFANEIEEFEQEVDLEVFIYDPSDDGHTFPEPQYYYLMLPTQTV